MSRAWAGGSTRRWREIRAAVLLRDRARCRVRVPGTWRTRSGQVRQCTGRATQAHHKHGKNRCTGCALDLLDHLVAACASCNLKLGDPGRSTAANRDVAKPRIKVVTRW